MKLNWCKTLIFAGMLSWAGSSLAQPASLPIQIKNYDEFATGLSNQETQVIESVFKEYPRQIVDLEASALYGLKSWLDTLNTRLTAANEKLSPDFPSYQIELISSHKPEVLFFRHSPRAQRFFNAYIFITTGFIEQMARRLGHSLTEIPKDQLEYLLDALTGVMAHESVNPIEETLIRWDWQRDLHTESATTRQASVLTTDLLSLPTLIEAKLSPECYLKSLLLSEPESSSRQSLGKKLITAAIDDSPQFTMRINLARGAIWRVAQTQGQTKVDPLPFDYDSMIRDFKKISGFDQLREVLARKTVYGLSDDASEVQRLATLIERKITEHAEFKHADYQEHLAALDASVIAQKSLSDADIQSLIRLQLTVAKAADGKFYASNAMFREDPLREKIQRAQRQLEKLSWLSDLRFQRWLAAFTLERQYWKFDLSNLAFAFARPQLELIYEHALRELDAFPPANQYAALIQLYQSATQLKGAEAWETKILEKLSHFLDTHPPDPSQSRFNSFASQFYNQWLIGFFGKQTEIHVWRGKFLREPKLLELWGKLISTAVSDPYKLEPLSLPTGEDATYELFWTLFSWYQEPSNRFLPFVKQTLVNRRAPGTVLKVDLIYADLEQALNSPAWREYLDLLKAPQTAQIPGVQIRHAELKLGALSFLLSAFDRKSSPFTLADKTRFLSGIFDSLPGFLKTRAIDELTRANPGLKEALLSEWYRKLSESERTTQIWNQIGQYYDLESQSYPYVRFCEVLRQKNLISESEYAKIIFEKVLHSDQHLAYHLELYDAPSAYLIWKHYRGSSAVPPDTFLKTVLGAFDLKKYRPELPEIPGFDPKGRRYGVEDLLALGLKYHPLYAGFLAKVPLGLKEDFARLLGYTFRTLPAASDARYTGAYFSHFDEVLAYLSMIFDPDKRPVPLYKRKEQGQTKLDPLAKIFVELLPQGLTPEESAEWWPQYERLWHTLTAKRANRYTDRLFAEHIRPYWLKLPLSEQIARARQALEFGAFQSDRWSIEQLKLVLKDSLIELKKSANTLSDSTVKNLVSEVFRLVPQASSYRDEFLNRQISEDLELSEAQIKKFIAPAKSYHYQSVQPAIVNLLSLMNVLIETLTIDERLDLIRYIQEPLTDLRTVIPRLNSLVQEIGTRLGNSLPSFVDGLFDRLESAIQDSNESERLLLIETIVGSRKSGLWYRGPKVRDQLMVLAKLALPSDPQEAAKIAPINPDLRLAFDHYLDALPEYARTLAVSYLLAAIDDGGKRDILKIFLMFNSVGQKGAQIASMLGIFGPDESKNLAQAKWSGNRPEPEDFDDLLRGALGDDLARKITRRKLIGDGSIKIVFAVTYDDGTPKGRKAAVYIRRPYLKATTDFNFNLVKNWMDRLKGDPKFSQKYDFSYYLKLLEAQMGDEMSFPREYALSVQMNNLYAKVPPYKGWSFGRVDRIEDLPHNEEVMHFTLIEGAVPLDHESVSESDRKIISQYILKTEFSHLFGVYSNEADSDRHLGNFLVNPETHKIYPLDSGQLFSIRPNGLFRPGDPYHLAKLVHGFIDQDKVKGAQTVFEAIWAFAETNQALSPSLKTELIQNIRAALQDPGDLQFKIFRLMEILSDQRIYLPMRVAFGVIKDVAILLNEDYVKNAGEAFLMQTLKDLVTEQLAYGIRFKAIETVREASVKAGTWVKKNCQQLLGY